MQEYLYRPPDYCAFIRDKFVDNEIIKEYELSLVAHVQGYASEAQILSRSRDHHLVTFRPSLSSKI